MRNVVAGVVVLMGSLTVACGAAPGESTGSADQAMMCNTCGDGTSSGGADTGGGGYLPPNTPVGACVDNVSGATDGDFVAAQQEQAGWAKQSAEPSVWQYEEYITTTKAWVSGSAQPYKLVPNAAGTGAWYGFLVTSTTSSRAKFDTGFNSYKSVDPVFAHTVKCSLDNGDGTFTTTYWLVHDPGCVNGCTTTHPASGTT